MSTEKTPRSYPISRKRTLQLLPAVGWRQVTVWIDDTTGEVGEEVWPIACFALVERWECEVRDRNTAFAAPSAPWHGDASDGYYASRYRWTVEAPSVEVVTTQEAGAYLDLEDDDDGERVLLGPGQEAGDDWVRREVARRTDRLVARRAERATPRQEAAS